MIHEDRVDDGPRSLNRVLTGEKESNRILGVSTAQWRQVDLQAQLQATRLDAEGADRCCCIEQSIVAAPHTPRIRLLSSERAGLWAFWLYNAGLVLWIVFDFFPIGWPQLDAAFKHGLAYARSTEFYGKTLFWQWMRLPGDRVWGPVEQKTGLRIVIGGVSEGAQFAPGD